MAEKEPAAGRITGGLPLDQVVHPNRRPLKVPVPSNGLPDFIRIGGSLAYKKPPASARS